MGVDQVDVLPGAGDLGQAGRVHLACGEHDLLATTAQLVAVDVDVRELVILPDPLELVVRGQEWTPVGNPYVGQRGLIASQDGGVECAVAGQIAHGDPVEVHRAARGHDVVVDVWPLGGELIRMHRHLFIQSGPDLAQDKTDGNPQNGHGGRGYEKAG